jgi:hypothetical protein
MVILHKDHGVYQIPDDLNKQTTLLNKFYYLKFEHLLKSKNIPYKLVDYENYDGDYYIGRFGHALPDKELHSKCFDKLYNHYGENMWPNKKAYYYYDDKVRQYELLEKYGIQVPSITCNNLDELLKNVTLGTVIKSTYGAGAESVLYVWKKEHLDNVEEYISKCYNSKNFFPCQVQEYIDVESVLQIYITENKVCVIKVKLSNQYESPLSFPHELEFRDTHWTTRGARTPIEREILKENDLDIEFVKKLCDIKRELNTPNMKFDVMDNKVLEFTYLYGQVLPTISLLTYDYYDIDTGKYESEILSVNDMAYKQQTSVLKHLGII